MTAKRIATFIVWILAIVLPGGLPALALYVSVRAARERAVLRGTAAPLHAAPGAVTLQG